MKQLKSCVACGESNFASALVCMKCGVIQSQGPGTGDGSRLGESGAAPVDPAQAGQAVDSGGPRDESSARPPSNEAITEPSPPARVIPGRFGPFDTRTPWRPAFLLRLLFRPRKYFTENLSNTPELPVNLMIFIVGIGLVYLRLAQAAETEMVNAKLAGATARPTTGDGNWLGHWGMLIGGGLFLGWMRYLIGGWWYRVRINWSGDWSANDEYARVVFIHSEIIWAIPMVAVAVYETFVYANPAIAADLCALRLVYLPAFLISYYYSWLGVTESFDVSGKWAAAWFLVLPAFITCSAFVVALVNLIISLATVAPK